MMSGRCRERPRAKGSILVRESLPKIGEICDTLSPRVSRMVERKTNGHYLNSEQIGQVLENCSRPKCIKE